MAAHGIRPIDLLVVNLYPFEATVAKGAGFDDCIENIDIGGPAMIRAAAKNHADVAVVVEPEDYAALLAELARARRRDHAGAAQEARRQGLCPHRRLRRRDLQLVRASSSTIRRRRSAPSAASSPRRCATARTRTRARRSTARRSSAPASPPRGRCRASSSPTTTSTTPTRPTNASPSSIPSAPPAVAIIKHANPCGVAEGASLRRGLSQGAAPAIRPRRSAASSRSTARSTRRPRKRHHRDFHRGHHRAGRHRRGDQRSSRRRRTCGCCSPAACPTRAPSGLTVKSVAGGLLVQSRDNATVDEMQLKTVTKRAPTAAELDDLRFAFRVAKHVKSNTIVYAKDRATVGIGAGQMSRSMPRASPRARPRTPRRS